MCIRDSIYAPPNTIFPTQTQQRPQSQPPTTPTTPIHIPSLHRQNLQQRQLFPHEETTSPEQISPTPYRPHFLQRQQLPPEESTSHEASSHAHITSPMKNFQILPSPPKLQPLQRLTSPPPPLLPRFSLDEPPTLPPRAPSQETVQPQPTTLAEISPPTPPDTRVNDPSYRPSLTFRNPDIPHPMQLRNRQQPATIMRGQREFILPPKQTFPAGRGHPPPRPPPPT